MLASELRVGNCFIILNPKKGEGFGGGERNTFYVMNILRLKGSRRRRISASRHEFDADINCPDILEISGNRAVLKIIL